MQDPRMQGFNYGTGWGSDPKPAIYFEGMKIAQALTAEATQKSTEAWALDMVLRDMRLATTPEEKERAVKALEEALNKMHNQILVVRR